MLYSSKIMLKNKKIVSVKKIVNSGSLFLHLVCFLFLVFEFQCLTDYKFYIINFMVTIQTLGS